jgi:aspartyl/asparaginyl beta-hydroxylase (cupin superfamily)
VFLNAKQFSFVELLEAQFQVIKGELMDLTPSAFVPYPDRNIYRGGWEVCGFTAFGQRLEKARDLCPRTSKLLDDIPGVTTAAFSRLLPSTDIRPHLGYSNSVLRCHLGLLVPPNCGLRVGPETRTWEEGKCLVFDDTIEHQAWNHSASARVVLLIDFVKPHHSFAPPPLPFDIPDDL